MKLPLVLLALVFLLSGCGTVNVLMGVGHDMHSNPVHGRNHTSQLGIEAQFREGSPWWATSQHNSSYADGWPFNDIESGVSDRVGATYKFKVK